MFNYIIPPIIIILGVATLIYFYVRKSAEIPESKILPVEGKKAGQGIVSSLKSKIGSLILGFLERVIQRFKLYSLKFHNRSQQWFHSIRKRRTENGQTTPSMQEKPVPSDDSTSSLRSSSSPEKKEARFSPRPTVSRTVVLPSEKKESKNKLEEALIERIAGNPQDIEAYERLGDYYLENVNYQESLECYKYVLKLSPTHRKAKYRVRRLEKMLGIKR